MRTELEIMELILNTARADERIRAVLLAGSRANPAVPRDRYQDYDVTYFVADIAPFYNQPAWVEDHFGSPLIMQMPEAMRYPDGDGHFIYMMIYPDGVRIDLSFEFRKYIDDGEPAVVLLDKDNRFPAIKNGISSRRRRSSFTPAAITSGGASIMSQKVSRGMNSPMSCTC